jgi:hypothetical protein
LHVFVGAKKIFEDLVVGAEAGIKAAAQEAGGSGEHHAADIGVGEADFIAVEFEFGADGGAGQHVRKGLDNARDGGGCEAEISEEREDGVRVPGGAEAQAQARRNLRLREAT